MVWQFQCLKVPKLKKRERKKKKHKKERDIKCSEPNNQVPFQLLLQIIRSEAATGIKNPKICHYGNGFSCNLLEKWKHPTKERKQKRTQMRKRQKEAETRGAVCWKASFYTRRLQLQRFVKDLRQSWGYEKRGVWFVNSVEGDPFMSYWSFESFDPIFVLHPPRIVVLHHLILYLRRLLTFTTFADFPYTYKNRADQQK